MTDRPITVETPHVRSLLAGRKTQHRVVLKPQLECFSHADWPEAPDPKPVIDADGLRCAICGAGVDLDHRRKSGVRAIPVPFAAGDRLWVRETFCNEPVQWHPGPTSLVFKADFEDKDRATTKSIMERHGVKWRPPFSLPRTFSRITLHVTEVRVQRLQAISRDDAIAEGMRYRPALRAWTAGDDSWPTFFDPTRSYFGLWQHLQGPKGWRVVTNPWVIALTFRVARTNIDAAAA